MSNGIDSEDKVMLIAIGMVAAPIMIGLVGAFIIEALKIIHGK